MQTPKKKTRWTNEEQNQVLVHFSERILNKDLPKRSQVEEFLKQNPELRKTRTTTQVYLFVRNHSSTAQLNLTPKVKRALQQFK